MTANNDLDFKNITSKNLEKTNFQGKKSSKKKNKPEEVVEQEIESAEITNEKSNVEGLNNDYIEPIEVTTEDPEITKLNFELEQTKSQMMRIAADAANSAKQNDIEIALQKKKTKKELVSKILPFLTTITLAITFALKNEENSKFIQTLEKSLNTLSEDLKSLNIKIILPQIGDVFDPVTMQALNANSDENPTVKNIAEVGCMVDEQVIKPASVLL